MQFACSAKWGQPTNCARSARGRRPMAHSRLAPRRSLLLVRRPPAGEFLGNTPARVGEARPRGMTLIELLITIMILVILAGLVLGVAAVAGETARVARTRHTIERLHTLLLDHYDTYKTRRVVLKTVANASGQPIEAQINASFSKASDRNQALAEARLYALREMMLMEIPDRWSDVLLTDVGTPGQDDNDSSAPKSFTPSNAIPPFYLAGRTDLSNAYLRRYASLVGRINTLTGVANTAGDIKRNQSAECLYMVVTMACGEGEARSLFPESMIGDTDGDGAPEFLDGWGHPISFLRWAPGFDSQIELNANQFFNSYSESATEDTANWIAGAAKDHDPFDVFRRESKAFRLVPLIYSWGRDEASGINSNIGYVAWINPPTSMSTKLSFNSSPPFIASRFALTPYKKIGRPLSFIGSDVHLVDPASYPDENATDNIHNHLMGQR